MAARALIFDLDGTVWDSAGWFAAALTRGEAAASAKFERSLKASGNIVRQLERVGMSRAALLREAARLSGPPPLFAGIGAALDEASANDKALAIATSLPGTIALPMLEMAGIASRFAPVIHAGVCRAAKPSPASINMALRQLGLDPEDAIYVGDRAVDAEAARRAGVAMAWVTHGYEEPAPGDRVLVVGAEDIAAL